MFGPNDNEYYCISGNWRWAQCKREFFFATSSHNPDQGLQVISGWIAGTFFFLFILVICGLCIRWSSKRQNRSAAQLMEEMSKLTQPSTASMSDKRRAELNEKYGLSG
jgi:hypothetical protein